METGKDVSVNLWKEIALLTVSNLSKQIAARHSKGNDRQVQYTGGDDWVSVASPPMLSHHLRNRLENKRTKSWRVKEKNNYDY